MIFEAIVEVLAGIFGFVGSLIPEIPLPGWVDGIAGHVATVTGFMAPLGVWLPFDAAGNATTFVLLAVGVAVVVRLVRVLLSLFTGGGGSAA